MPIIQYPDGCIVWILKTLFFIIQLACKFDGNLSIGMRCGPYPIQREIYFKRFEFFNYIADGEPWQKKKKNYTADDGFNGTGIGFFFCPA